MEVFSFEDYKQFIRHQLAENADTRGYQSKLAVAAGCQKSYFSQVLNFDSHLTPEQAVRLTEFWEMPAEESDWFLETLALARTQYEPLRKRIRRRLRAIQAERENLAERSKRPRIRALEHESAYYSSWYWSAIHILSSVPAYRKVDAMAERLCLPKDVVRNTLRSLEDLGLVMRQGTEWTVAPDGLHLPKESILAPMHHSNWRQKAVLDARFADRDSLHYTDVVSHSFDDFHRLKSLLLKAVEEWRAGVRVSPEQDVSCLCLDFFRV